MGWGVKPNSPLFSEVDAQGRALLTVTFPSGEFSYRVIKVPVTALDHSFLRVTAGLPQFVRVTSPVVSFVGSSRRPNTGGATLTVTGVGFTGATAVSIGQNPAASFIVNNDSSITAIAPGGSGAVSVTVTTPGGTSPTTAGSILTSTDANLDVDIGSWRSTGSLAPNTVYAQSGNSSLQLTSPSNGMESVASGRYALPARALVNGSGWVLTPQRSDRVRTFIAFYDSAGKLISVVEGHMIETRSSAWTQAAETTVSPAGTASAALGLEDASGVGPVYLDSASLVGSNAYEYQSPDDESSSGHI